MPESEYRFMPSPYPYKPDCKQVVVDPTLTIPGYAADAKVTGDELAKKLPKEVIEDSNTLALESLGANPKLEIKGFTLAEGNTVPSKDAEGKLTWITAASSGEIEALKARVSILEGQVTTLQGLINTLQTKVGEHSNLIQSLQNAVNSLQTSISNLQQRITQIENTYATKEYVDEKDEALHNEFLSITADLSEQILNLQDSIELLRADITLLNQKVTSLIDWKGEVNTRLEKHNSRLHKIEDSYISVDPQNWTEQQKAQARANIGASGGGEELEERVAALENTVNNTLVPHVDQLQNSVNTLSQNLETYKQYVAFTYETKADAAATYETIAQHTAEIGDVTKLGGKTVTDYEVETRTKVTIVEENVTKINAIIGDTTQISGTIVENINNLAKRINNIDGGTDFTQTIKHVNDTFSINCQLANTYANITSAAVKVVSEDEVLNLTDGVWQVGEMKAFDKNTKTGAATWSTGTTISGNILKLDYKAISKGRSDINIIFTAKTTETAQEQGEVIPCGQIKVL